MAKTPAGSSALFRAAFLVLTLAFILLIVGFTTPNWTEVVLGDVLGSRSGLWKSCTDIVGSGETCGESTYEDERWFVIVRTFVILSLVCFVLVMLISLALLLAVSNQRLARVNVYTCVFTVLFLIIATSTYTYMVEFEHLGYSYWLCWFSAAALVVAVILLECARKKAYRRELMLTHVDVATAENHSYPMQDLTPQLTRANQPLVVHHSDHDEEGHAVDAAPEKNVLKKQ